MKIEISITSRHYDLLCEISSYVGKSAELVAKDIIETHVDNFDKEMTKIANVIYEGYYEGEEI